MKTKFIFPFLAVSLCISAHADLPLSIEDIVTEKGKIRLEAGVSYVNGESSKNRFAHPIYIQTGNNTFVAVPTALENADSNSDMVVGTLGLRYGLTGKTDVYTGASHLWRSAREFDGSGSLKSRNRRLSDVLLGVSHTFVQDGKNPALIGFVETVLYEQSNGKSSSGKSWTAGLTTYKAIDLVVLSFTGAYRRNLPKKTAEGGRFQAGSYMMLNPSVSFAANDRISFTGGVQWLNAQADKVNGERQSARNTSTYAHAGVGFGLTRDTVLNASVRGKVSVAGSSEFKLGMTHKF